MAQANNGGSRPQMSEMLQSLLSALNSEDSGEKASSDSGFGSADESFSTGENAGAGFDFGSFFENIDLEMLMKAGEIFARFNSPDKNTELLRALKPHMREENREKIDTAIKLIKITALLPFLRESGLFDKMFN
ncbi:MAG: hypothetical protein LBC82_06715 [Oscillospiraceae bacterium]|nr:hypothetical protein [Oscillospiraceae bacterium]